MRILVDENNLPWAAAWDMTRATVAFTNHTLLPEALEKWPVDLLGRVLPRHLQIIYEINRRFLEQVAARCPHDVDRVRRMSLVEEGPTKLVRMAHLAVVGSHSVNGVSALHTELLKHGMFRDFYQMWPERFNNKTNGITPRRWLLNANPGLAGLITSTIGDAWITDLFQLRQLEPWARDGAFQEEFRRIKKANKEQLGRLIYDSTRVRVNPEALFDIQAKRIHEYKRQLLNIMHIIHTYLALVEDGVLPPVPKVYVFAGKAAPGYWAAKQLIKLINYLGEVINRDARVHDWLKVVFVPDYRVSLAEQLIPAAAKLAPRASRFRLEDFVRAYLEHSKVHKSHSSYRADRLALDKLLADEDFGPTRSWSDRFPGPAEVYGAPQGYPDSRILPWRCTFIRENPFAEIKEPKVKKGRPRFLSQEIIRLLAAETDPAFHRQRTQAGAHHPANRRDPGGAWQRGGEALPLDPGRRVPSFHAHGPAGQSQSPAP